MTKAAGARASAMIVTLAAGLLVSASAQAAAPAAAPVEPAKTNRGAATFDALVVRPLNFAVLPIGVAAFIPTALLSAAGGKDSIEAALELFVTEPAKYVFQRPLGEF